MVIRKFMLVFKRTYLWTPWITGTAPGSRMLYDTPVKVVPTSIPITSLRCPEYGCLLVVAMTEADKGSDPVKEALTEMEMPGFVNLSDGKKTVPLNDLETP
jgi:hypothetical protein